MTMTIDAIYEAGVFRPLEQMDLTEGKQVKLTVADEDMALPLLSPPDPSRVAEIMTEIAALSVHRGEPDYGGRDHDLILYGGPEGAR